mmetsp:Transcript_121331/g.259016  ORF Transcript_121331/g.259016 Transcript_121331/m.259016 type:complete len:257 (-) Transcript_121331:416-1186(-)
MIDDQLKALPAHPQVLGDHVDGDKSKGCCTCGTTDLPKNEARGSCGERASSNENHSEERKDRIEHLEDRRHKQTRTLHTALHVLNDLGAKDGAEDSSYDCEPCQEYVCLRRGEARIATCERAAPLLTSPEQKGACSEAHSAQHVMPIGEEVPSVFQDALIWACYRLNHAIVTPARRELHEPHERRCGDAGKSTHIERRPPPPDRLDGCADTISQGTTKRHGHGHDAIHRCTIFLGVVVGDHNGANGHERDLTDTHK